VRLADCNPIAASPYEVRTPLFVWVLLGPLLIRAVQGRWWELGKKREDEMETRRPREE
jgi:hypothetical protein